MLQTRQFRVLSLVLVVVSGGPANAESGGASRVGWAWTCIFRDWWLCLASQALFITFDRVLC
jgi:hypothetical protein